VTRTRVRKLQSNSEPCGGRKPASEVTDRALRYRANSEECKPAGPKRCMWCGARKVEVAHIDGDETNTVEENLAWTCRPCNQKVAANYKKHGVGRPTNQYNPKRKKRRGATDWRQYAEALSITKGETIGNLDDAIQLIHDTPKSRRSEFQVDVWQRRKELYGPSGRKDGGSVPF
jgi:hypothetical protein